MAFSESPGDRREQRSIDHLGAEGFRVARVASGCQKDGQVNQYSMGVTLWLFNIAIENGPFIVDFPIKHGDFP